GQAPRRIERAVGRESANEVAVHVEDVDKAVSGTGDVVVAGGVVFGVGDEELSFDVLNAEGRESGRNGRIDEGAEAAAAEGHLGEVRVIHVDGAGPEIRCVDEIAGAVVADGESFVDRAI